MLIKYYRVGGFELSIGQRIDKFCGINPYVFRNQRDNWKVDDSFLGWRRETQGIWSSSLETLTGLKWGFLTRVGRRKEY